MRSFLAASMTAVLLSACGSTTTQPSDQPSTTPTPTPSSSATSRSFAAVGVVYDTAGRPLAGATVEVVGGGTALGDRRVTDPSGRFSFEAVDDHLTVRASKAGYQTQTKSYGSADAAAAREFWIKLESDAAATLGGNYLLTFTADSACSDLPDAVRTRTYSATIASGSHDVLSLGGAVFVQRGYPYNTVYVAQAGDYAAFNFNDPGILERVTSRSYLWIYGAAEGTTTSAGGRLPMWGHITYCAQQSGADYDSCPVPLNTCSSQNHTLTVLRQ